MTNKFLNAITTNEKAITENGAIGFANTTHPLTKLNFIVPSFRKEGINKQLFLNSLAEDANLTLRWLLYLRDITYGIGERDAYRKFVLALIEENEELGISFIKEIPLEGYGRYDDPIYIYDKTNNNTVKEIIAKKLKKQFFEDYNNMVRNETVSLLAKWLPSENASSVATRQLAKKVRENIFELSPRNYRKILSKLRSYLKVVEVDMSANNWGDINYEKVPSLANLRYRNAFMEHDTDRRKEYLDSLKKGTTKINANSMFIHDIVHSYSYNSEVDETLEQMWKAQKKCCGFNDTLVVRDGSGSMSCTIGNSKVTAMDVANAITLYCAENNTGAFKDKFITFSARPKLIDLTGHNTLLSKLQTLYKEDECSNTNIKATFDLILNSAIKNHLTQDDMPETILIISDMEFDTATCNNWCYNGIFDKPSEALFETISKEFDKHGYKLPKLVFWNVNSRTNTVPLNENELGVTLLSGFNKNLIDMVMESELDPFLALKRALMIERYYFIDKIVK